ncbi:hypothetical protein [Rhodococcus koreensis]|uniref:hypothetical protein n=1 Tax=Rhodococcus koreensis TaxID=99653 RepID=UPI00198206A5|nr:hypothetical protein [Rhodococcus koreensis]QSE84902.1 hypothetical protein JWS14_40380 [Rhodococcus koreensis]
MSRYSHARPPAATGRIGSDPENASLPVVGRTLPFDRRTTPVLHPRGVEPIVCGRSVPRRPVLAAAGRSQTGRRRG